MKRLNVLLKLAALLLLVAAHGCGSDEDLPKEKPVIRALENSTPNGATFAEGAPLLLAFMAEKGEDGAMLSSVLVEEFVNSERPGRVLYDTTGLNDETFGFYEAGWTARLINDADTDYRWRVTVTDHNNRMAVKNIMFRVEKYNEDDTTAKQPKLISATFDTEKMFMNSAAENPVSMTIADANAQKSEIDLTYFYSEAHDSYSFISPFVRSSQLYNHTPAYIINYPQNTIFYVVSTKEDRFDRLKNLDQAALQDEISQGSHSQWPGNPSGARVGSFSRQNLVGEIYGFRTADERSGLIRITGRNGKAIDVEILVQH